MRLSVTYCYDQNLDTTQRCYSNNNNSKYHINIINYKHEKIINNFIFLILVASLVGRDLFKTPQEINLRAPAVPIVTSDPYLSIWSPYNSLTEGNTEHWTGTEHPLIGAIRVDGKVFRFMGKDKPDFPILLPMSNDNQWFGQYTFQKPTGNWTSLEYNDSDWKKRRRSIWYRWNAKKKNEMGY